MSEESRASRVVREALESGRPIVYVRSPEEERVSRIIAEVAQRMDSGTPAKVWTWTLTEGLRHDACPMESGTGSPRAALDYIASHTEPGIFHLKDFHEPLRDSAEIRRRLRDLSVILRDQHRFVIITSPVRSIPEEVERSLLFIELRTPDVVELATVMREEGRDTDEETVAQLAPTLQGLTHEEARYAVRRALVAKGRLGTESLPELLEEKRLLVNRSGVIEFISDGPRMGDLGGLEGLKKWLLERRKLFQMRDQISSEIVPKGVLLMGIPGCGKSLCVKATAAYFQLPLYRADMSAIFSGRFGKPDGVFVEACRMMEDLAPAILWFDEIEMGITSTESSGEQGRIFAFFLTWMQEKTKGLFVAATANRIDLLPAEMIRKGRFDEVFFVDLPTDEERLEIYRIHLTRRGVDADKCDLDQLTEFTKGWTGAEIEQCVVSAITRARLEDREVTGRDLLNVAVKTVPLSRTMHEQINHIRSWAFDRAIRASPKQALK